MEPRGSGWTVVRMQVKHLPRSWHTQGESTRLLLPWGHPALSGLTVVGEGHLPHPALPCCVPAVSHTGGTAYAFGSASPTSMAHMESTA